MFRAEIFILWCIVQKYWSGIVTCYMKMRQINELHADLTSFNIQLCKKTQGAVGWVKRFGRDLPKKRCFFTPSLTCNDTWPIFLHNTPKYENFCTEHSKLNISARKKSSRLAQQGLSKNIHLWAQEGQATQGGKAAREPRENINWCSQHDSHGKTELPNIQKTFTFKFF